MGNKNTPFQDYDCSPAIASAALAVSAWAESKGSKGARHMFSTAADAGWARRKVLKAVYGDWSLAPQGIHCEVLAVGRPQPPHPVAIIRARQTTFIFSGLTVPMKWWRLF